MPFIDLTHCFTAKMPVYPGDPEPVLRQSSHLGHDGFNDYHLATSMHVGTHMDGPLHMIPSGKKLCDFPVDTFFGKGVLVDALQQSSGQAVRQTRIGAQILSSHDLQKGDIVLVRTGFSAFYGQQKYFEEYPEITEDFAEKLIDAGVKILGLDSPSPDRPPFKIHKLLLKHDILIIENLMNLDKIPDNTEFQIIALPAKLDADSAPVRVAVKY